MSDESDRVELATELTKAWLANTNTRVHADDVPAFLETIHRTLGELGAASAAAVEEAPAEHTPAVSIRKSLASREHIISLIDGKPYRTLRRHLSKHGLTPDDYRKRYGLKSDYPMVAQAYSEARSAMAKTIGLGRKAGQKAEAAVEGAAKKVQRRGKAALAAARDVLGTGDDTGEA